MDLRPHLKKGIWALFDKGLTGIYGFAFIYSVMSKLPREEYGVYSIIFAFTSMALLFNKGFILYPMTKYEAEGGSKPKLLGTTLIVSFVTLSIFALAIFLFAPLGNRIFNTEELTPLLRLVPLLIASFFFRDFTLSYLQAHRRIKALSIVDAIYFLGLAVTFVILSLTGVLKSAMTAAWLHIAFASLSSAACYLVVRKDIKIDFRFSREEFKRLGRFGRYSLSMGLGELIFYQVDLLLLGRFFDPVAVAMYQSAKLLFRFYSLLSQSLNLLIFPGTSKLHHQQRLDDIRSMYSKVIAYYWSLMLVLNIVLFAGAGMIMKIVSYPESANIFRIFLVFSFFEPLYTVSMSVLYGMGKPKLAFKPLIFAIPLYIGLNLLLIPSFHGYGAALAFNINNLFLGISYLYILKKEIGVRTADIFNHIREYPSLIRKIAATRVNK